MASILAACKRFCPWKARGKCVSTRTGGFLKTAILAAAFPSASAALKGHFGLARGKIGNERLAGDRNLSFAGQHPRALRKVNVDA